MTSDAPAPGLGAFIDGNMEPILQEWEAFAHALMPLAELDRAALRDHAEEMLRAVVDDMRAPQSEQQRADKAQGLRSDNMPQLTRAAQAHAVSRFGDEFTMDQLVAEFRAIRASVLKQWAVGRGKTDEAVEELMRFNEAIDQALSISIARYSVKLDESRALILGVLAHDLRNPLHALSIGLHYIVRNESTDANSTKAAARALKSVDRMDGLIRDLLDFTLVRLGPGLPVTPQPENLALICARTVDEVEASHPGRRLRCRIAEPVHGEWDPKRISQMLVNLLTNALQHGDPHGEVTLALAATPTEVRLDVHNQGPAIPEARRATLFQPLTHAALDARAGVARSSGLGLGLYIACQIATAHGGSVKVASTDAEGTTFTVRMPRHAAPPCG
ncbi:HAMP domain-containing histidine kinase [Schlegelella sp. S2-27]|uniref:histidine kinase n=1 Tax=Caldimonas mangrovi TaxID=2944811 RepID=A0ABT0YP63_9BURK|nr:HAMP domain-containing sensor histidine kinase [Caldimonas mangrovi]MCM5680514.1 HAMP domain-containing histidine kinase [Caldimonas mangrovi]